MKHGYLFGLLLAILATAKGADPMGADSLIVASWDQLTPAKKIKAAIDQSISLVADDTDQAWAYVEYAIKIARTSPPPPNAYQAWAHQSFFLLEQFHDRQGAIQGFQQGLASLSDGPSLEGKGKEPYIELWLGLGQAYDGVNLDSMEYYAQLAYDAASRPEVSLLLQYDAYTLLGNVSLQQGPLALNQAIKCYQQAYLLTKQAGVEDLSSVAASNLGVTYLEDGRYEEALTYFTIALYGLGATDHIALQINTYYNMAKAHQGLGNDSTALAYFKQGEDLARVDEDYDALVDILIQRSTLLIHQDRLDSAQKALEVATKMLPFTGSELRKTELDLAWASWLLKQDQIVDAHQYYVNAFSGMHELPAKLKLESLEGLAETSSRLGKVQESNRYWKMYAQEVDSIYAREKTQQVAAMQARFETLQAREEARRLQEIQVKDKRIIVLQRWLLFSLVGLGFFLIVLIYRLYLANVQKAEMNQRLAQLNQDKDMLMRVVAHDLKAPLANIRGLTEFLTHTSELPKDQQQVIGMISTEANRSEDLARNLLDLDTLEHGSVQLNIQRTDATDVAKTLRLRYEKAAANKQQTIVLEGVATSIPIYTDLGYLYRILDNLLSNAVKYSPIESVITMKVSSVSDRIRFQVVDQGPGLSEADKGRIFQKFAKLSARPTGGESSTGLGLAIAKSLAEKLEGSLSVESTLGKGASFLLEIPSHYATDLS